MAVENAEATRITSELLKKHGACSEGVADFVCSFPNGAIYPDDIEKARHEDLDVNWLSQLGLPVPEAA